MSFSTHSPPSGRIRRRRWPSSFRKPASPWRARAKTPEFDFRPLEPGVISVSPLRDNILDPDKLAGAVRAMVPQNGSRKRRDAALILPDSCVRVSVLDFDNFPSDAKEQLSLVRFRMKKSVPYDVESAVLSYHAQAAGGKRKKDRRGGGGGAA